MGVFLSLTLSKFLPWNTLYFWRNTYWEVSSLKGVKFLLRDHFTVFLFLHFRFHAILRILLIAKQAREKSPSKFDTVSYTLLVKLTPHWLTDWLTDWLRIWKTQSDLERGSFVSLRDSRPTERPKVRRFFPLAIKAEIEKRRSRKNVKYNYVTVVLSLFERRG